MKKWLTLVSGVASACALNAAYAQSSVTLYGVIDNGIEYQNAGSGGAVRATSGGLFASRYGLKGSEDIGNGLYVNFQLEQGFNGATGAAASSTAAFNRQAWVGLSGAFGETRIGLQNTPQYIFLNPELDPLSVMSIGSPMNNFNTLTVRVNNAISYFTPTIYGLTAQFMVAMRDSTTKPSNGFQFYNAVVRYVNGPFHLAAGYEQADNATGTSTLKVLNVGSSITVGNAQFYLAYHNERQTDNSVKRDVYAASTSYSFTPADDLSVMYGYAHDRTGAGNNAQQIGLTFEHLLSKRTTLYASAGFIQNRGDAQFSLNGTNYQGLKGAPGANTRGIALGIMHRF
ncbi:porin [Paraburkholderia metrosideri]|jgi:predicted porin|uniref:Outer membrane porin protein 32 n=1 Tax=Paraburkholderia metrosideri TaxID=580937 RepID=A0ABN7IEG6_9BURK|nr:porin [Paraburkholderia metrosideri]CAD6557587.1 Outer membrane porin protein 32 [Paraburkholderia metrosideri]